MVSFCCNNYHNLCAGQVIVEQHPISLRVSVGEIAVFTCKARCEQPCTTYWVINGTDAYIEDEDSFVQMGFTFSRDKESQNIYNATLTVNATNAVNNTNLYCVFDNNGSNHSLTATLRIISGKKNKIIMILNWEFNNILLLFP